MGDRELSDAIWIAMMVFLGVTQALPISAPGRDEPGARSAEAAYISILGTLAGLSWR